MGLLDGKVAIVTGAASGIGRAGARIMAREGATPVVADIDVPGARNTVAQIEADGGRANACLVDVRDSASVQGMVAETMDRYGRIDVLFHNAVSVPLINRQDKRATELPDETWRRIIDLVLSGTFYCAKYVARTMLARRSGSIILTATVDALIGQAGIDGYTAAKGGVVSLTRSMAAGLSPEGVRVNAICPGFVETPHQAAFLGVPAERAKLEALHLMPILQPED
ncbi:MAG: SDR family NAD(P)-dependent oxidoreductase, partial [Alphaproteobacteria bacterium]